MQDPATLLFPVRIHIGLPLLPHARTVDLHSLNLSSYLSSYINSCLSFILRLFCCDPSRFPKTVRRCDRFGFRALPSITTPLSRVRFTNPFHDREYRFNFPRPKSRALVASSVQSSPINLLNLPVSPQDLGTQHHNHSHGIPKLANSGDSCLRKSSFRANMDSM